jgi:hypothetical protein
MKRKIVYLIDYPMTKLRFVELGIGNFIDSGINVEVIDAYSIESKDDYRKFIPNDLKSNLKITKVHKYSKLKDLLEGYVCDDIFIISYRANYILNRVVHILNKNDILIACIRNGTLPVPNNSNENIVNKIVRILNAYTFSFILNHLFQKILNYLSYIFLAPKITYFFYGGTFALTSAEKILSNSKYLISSHSPDYDLFLNNANNRTSLDNRDAIVFIDQNFLDDVDILLLGKKDSKASSNEIRLDFKNKINFFFDSLEKKFSCKVIISAHPKANIKMLSDCYTGREVIAGDTINLIKDCKFCITHSSTAINFAVLYKKPIMVVQMEILRSILGDSSYPFANSFANALNIKPTKIDEGIEEIQFPEVDESAYLNYVKMYIKEANGENISSWDLVKKTINIE